MATEIDSALGAATIPPADPAGDTPLRIREVTAEDLLTMVGSAAAALALDWVLYERVLPFTGVLGFWICWYALFLLCYTGVASLQWNALAVQGPGLSLALTTAGLLATGLVIDQVGYTLVRGFTVVKRTSFFTQSMANTAALSPITSGGIGHALVGTLEQLALATTAVGPAWHRRRTLPGRGGRPCRPSGAHAR